ncbi:winged helix-turn-helix transcriptional regulator [Methanoculleus sp. Afa-1]|uniref:Winged helix-turn-helix transcriptional regulator n=1 Tax=Methanoculleus formosensis TaxID=2590886 RepID=A0A9E4ZI09_9EURY|nr:winged helix-turn-helix transcriptional regulator [Methanoculleus sp. Afa-1]
MGPDSGDAGSRSARSYSYIRIYQYASVQGRIKLLKALADETRVKIVQCLMDGERCACTLVPAVGKAQPTVSQHLRILEEAGILESRRDGVNIWYRIRSDQAVQILKILDIQSIEIPISCSGGDRDER